MFATARELGCSILRIDTTWFLSNRSCEIRSWRSLSPAYRCLCRHLPGQGSIRTRFKDIRGLRRPPANRSCPLVPFRGNQAKTDHRAIHSDRSPSGLASHSSVDIGLSIYHRSWLPACLGFGATGFGRAESDALSIVVDFHEVALSVQLTRGRNDRRDRLAADKGLGFSIAFRTKSSKRFHGGSKRDRLKNQKQNRNQNPMTLFRELLFP